MMIATGAPCDEAEKRRDKLSLRRKEAKAISVPSNVEKDELISHDVPLVPVTTRSFGKSYAESDNRWIGSSFAGNSSSCCLIQPSQQMTWLCFPDIVRDNDLTVTSPEVKMSDCNNEIKWTALPKLCRKCFGIKRKRTGTENVTSKLHCDSSRELLPKATLLDTNTEHTGGKDSPSDPVSSNSSRTLADNMTVSAGCSSGTTVSNDGVVCASVNAVSTSASAASTLSSSRNSSCLSSVTLQNSVIKSPRAGFVRPLFQNSVFEFDSQLKEAASPGSTVSSVKVTATVDMKRDLDLHRCPLCDMVFDVRCGKEERDSHMVTCIGEADSDMAW